MHLCGHFERSHTGLSDTVAACNILRRILRAENTLDFNPMLVAGKVSCSATTPKAENNKMLAVTRRENATVLVIIVVRVSAVFC